MDKRDILQHIIDNNGVCRVLYSGDYTMCTSCPMSRLSQRSDGTYLSCWDSLGLCSPFGEQKHINDTYLNKAIEILGDILMDDILRGTPIAEDP